MGSTQGQKEARGPERKQRVMLHEDGRQAASRHEGLCGLWLGFGFYTESSEKTSEGLGGDNEVRPVHAQQSFGQTRDAGFLL